MTLSASLLLGSTPAVANLISNTEHRCLAARSPPEPPTMMTIPLSSRGGTTMSVVLGSPLQDTGREDVTSHNRDEERGKVGVEG